MRPLGSSGLRRANMARTACYHFATQLPDTGRDRTGLRELSGSEKPNKQELVWMARYKNGRPLANFECGAFNHSATSPGAKNRQFIAVVGVF